MANETHDPVQEEYWRRVERLNAAHGRFDILWAAMCERSRRYGEASPAVERAEAELAIALKSAQLDAMRDLTLWGQQHQGRAFKAYRPEWVERAFREDCTSWAL